MNLPTEPSYTESGTQWLSRSSNNRDSDATAAHSLALCIFSVSFLVAPAATHWLFAVLAFILPVFKRHLLPAFLPVVALASLIAAQEISGDTANYVRAFKELSETESILATAYRWSASAEPVFWYVTYWVNVGAADNPRITLLFWALFSIGSTALGFRFVSRDAFPLALALFLSTIYFYYAFGNAIRQGAAIGLLVLALGCLCQERRRLAQIFALLAVGCHLTAITLLPFFAVKAKSRRLVYVLFVAMTLVSLLLLTSYTLWSDFATGVAPASLENKFNKYFVGNAWQDTLLSFNSMRMIGFGLLVWLVSRHESLRAPHFGYIAAFTIYTFIIQIGVAGSDIVFNRLALYRMPAEFLAYALLLAEARKIKALEPLMLLMIPLYVIASGVVALGLEGYLQHSGKTFLSALAIVID